MSAHEYVPPDPGHVDGPTACQECGYGPLAPQHPQPVAAFDRVWAAAEKATQTALNAQVLESRVLMAVQVAESLGAQLTALTGTDGGRSDHVIAYAHGAILRILRALHGETDPARLRFVGPMPMPPRRDDQVEQLPIIGAA